MSANQTSNKKMNLTKSIIQCLEEYMRDVYESNYYKLPNEKELAQMFNVSRITIRAALDTFEQKGMVIRKQGSGTFINPEAMDIKTSLVPGLEFSNLIKKSGYKSTNKVIEAVVTKPNAELQEVFNINENEHVIRIGKVYFANNYPCIVSVDYIPNKVMKKDFNLNNYELFSGEKSVYNILSEFGEETILIDKIGIQAIPERESRIYLQNRRFLKCEAVLLNKSVNFNEANDPVMYTIEIHDTNFIKFDLMRVKNIYP